MVKPIQSLAFVFPGQGSQSLGMLKTAFDTYPLVAQTFAQASSALGKDLFALTQASDDSQLNQTQNTQPVLLTASVALWRVWQHLKGPIPAFLAGHSLGEYSALVCANAMSLEDAVKLVAYRGQLMQEAVPLGVGAMAAVIGMDDTALLEAICREASENEVVSCANFNAIGQTVIAGNTKAVERACALAKERGAKKTMLLPVSVPSHCALMESAAEKMTQALADIRISSPTIPVIHNADVQVHQNPDEIRSALISQLYRPVRWVETVQRLVNEGVQHVVECGSSKVLAGLIKRIDPLIKPLNIELPADLEGAIQLFNSEKVGH
ncbi:MAG: ACP S-malonyltransferase [Candidatus Berkiella sp.]